MTTATYVHKSERLAEQGKEAGWSTKIVPDISNPLEIVWTIYFSRKPEVMKVVYVGNRMTEATYRAGGKTVSPPHKAAVVKILTGQPDLLRMDGNTVMANRKLPFDPEDVLPSRILDALIGKRIYWVNSYSTELDTEKIEIHRNKNSRWFRIIRTSDGRRYVEFTSDHGFRAVYLDAIVSVR